MARERRKRATALILNDEKILLIQRVKAGQNYFIFPGGGIEAGESAENALIRETKEELSLEVQKYKFIFLIENLAVPSFITIHNGNRDEYYFLVQDYTGIPEIGGPEKESMNDQNQYHIVWLSLSEIEKMENIYPREGVWKLIEFLRNSKEKK